MSRRFLVGLLLVPALSGCGSVAPGQVGHSAGTVAGAILAPGIGGPIGGLIGMLAGMAVQKKMDDATETRERKELGGKLARGPGGDMAAAGAPTRVWVDETLKDGRLVAGHFETRMMP